MSALSSDPPVHLVMASLSSPHFDLTHTFSSFNAHLLEPSMPQLCTVCQRHLACKKSLTLALIVDYIFTSTHSLNHTAVTF